MMDQLSLMANQARAAQAAQSSTTDGQKFDAGTALTDKMRAMNPSPTPGGPWNTSPLIAPGTPKIEDRGPTAETPTLTPRAPIDQPSFGPQAVPGGYQDTPYSPVGVTASNAGFFGR